MSFGLSRETRRDGLNWNETVGYLEAISHAGRPVLVRAKDRRIDTLPVFQARGYLSVMGAQQDPPGIWCGVSWPLRDRLNGSFFVSPRLFETGSLSTVDGDDYFGLVFDTGAIEVTISDVNTVDWPSPDPKLVLQARSVAAGLVRWLFYALPEVREDRASRVFLRARALIERRGHRSISQPIASRAAVPPPSPAIDDSHES